MLRRSAAVLVMSLLVSGVSAITTREPAAAGQQLQLYVTPTGSDAAQGTEQAPLRTLQAAQARVRAIKDTPEAAAGVTVNLGGGTYELASSLQFTDQDSGTASAPVAYRARQGETAVLTAAKAIPSAAVTVVQDPAMRDRLPSSVRDRVRQVKLADVGVTDLGTPQAAAPGADRPELPAILQGSVRTHAARYPNDSDLTIGDVLSDNSPTVWRLADARPFAWKDSGDVWVFGKPAYDWAFQSMRVQRFDAAARSVTMADSSAFGSIKGQPFYFYNVAEELDRPDESYLDRATGIMYFIPSGEPAYVTAHPGPMVTIDGAANLTFSGLTFNGARGNGLTVKDATNIRVVGSTFTNLGLRAAHVTASTRTVFDGIDVHDTGAGGVLLQGGNRASLAPGQNVVRNSRFRRFQQLYTTYSAAVELSGVGNSMINNEISDAPHLAVMLRGNDHVVENNYIHDVVQDSTDSGAVYGAHDWSERGTRIVNNVISRVGKPGGKDDVVAIYLDDMMSGIEIRNNLITDVPRGVQHCGWDNIVAGNVMVNTTIPVNIGSWASHNAGPGGQLEQLLREVPYTSSAWLKYPHLAGILADPQRGFPKYATVTSNAFVASGQPVYPDVMLATSRIADNATLRADAVSSPTPGAYALASDSAVWKIPGFTGVSIDKVGVRGSIGASDLGQSQPSAPMATSTPTATSAPSVTASPEAVPTGPAVRPSPVDAVDGDSVVPAGGRVRDRMAYDNLDSFTDYAVLVELHNLDTNVSTGVSVSSRLSTGPGRTGVIEVGYPVPAGLSGRYVARVRLQHAVGHIAATGESRTVLTID